METLHRLFGIEAWRALQAAFGGTVLHIPLQVEATHPIAVALGHARAVALANECGGCNFHIAKPAFRDRLVAAVALGLNNKDIAIRLGVTERHVYAQRRKHRLRPCDLSSNLLEDES